MRRLLSGVVLSLTMAVVLSLIVSGHLLAGENSTQKLSDERTRMIVRKGVVEHGEKVPIPAGVSKQNVTIHLSVRSLPDHSQISGRIQCRLKPDGVTAVVRNVRRYQQEGETTYENKVKEDEILAKGKANYLLIGRKPANEAKDEKEANR